MTPDRRDDIWLAFSAERSGDDFRISQANWIGLRRFVDAVSLEWL
jgi:hypothetical protein